MNWIHLGNPVPRAKSEPYEPIRWPRFDERRLPEMADPGTSFAEVVSGRRSHRDFADLPIEKLGSLLKLACKVRGRLGSVQGLTQSTRPAPSAGALHPIHVILHRSGEELWQRYDPYNHSLVGLQANHSPSNVRDSLAEVLVGGDATLMLFVADPDLTFAKYEQACSLIWRDAGVLQGVFSLAAEALGLHWCLLGVTGEPWASGLIQEHPLVGVGAAYVGAPS